MYVVIGSKSAFRCQKSLRANASSSFMCGPSPSPRQAIPQRFDAPSIPVAATCSEAQPQGPGEARRGDFWARDWRFRQAPSTKLDKPPIGSKHAVVDSDTHHFKQGPPPVPLRTRSSSSSKGPPLFQQESLSLGGAGKAVVTVLLLVGSCPAVVAASSRGSNRSEYLYRPTDD